MKRHLQSTYLAQYSDQFIEDKLDLILPRHDFIIGGTIPFELKFTTTPKAWDIALRMNKLYTKLRNPKFQNSDFKFFTHLYTLERSVYEKSNWGHCFCGVLDIPVKIPPTIRSSNTPTRCGGELIHQIEYILEVSLYIEDMTSPPIVEVPIELGFSRKSKNDLLQPISENVQEILTEMDEVNSLLSTRLEGLRLNESCIGIQDRPPRYSRLALPIAGCSRSNSVETLPPYYEDVLTGSNR